MAFATRPARLSPNRNIPRKHRTLTDATLIADPSDIAPISIVDEMRSSYLDYAMSVIVARALPDVRDGLKPVHRRILFSAQESG